MRVKNWERSFNELLEYKATQQFSWGVNDCCLFTADFIAAITGVDLAQGIRGSYHDALGAARFVKAMGGIDGIADAILDFNGFKRTLPALSRRGDALLIEIKKSRFAFGVNGGNYALFSGYDGLVRFPISKTKLAWRIE